VIPELGQFALVLALLLALVQGILPLVGAASGRPAWMALARPAAWGQFVFLLISFLMLAAAFVNQDFSVVYVAQNSNSLLPVHYRISAVWGAHEGSLLLWILILGVWSVAVATFSRSLPQVMAARVLGVMGLVSVGFLLFSLLTSNPFLRHLPALSEGRDLNPLLQDFGLIVHPPMLYVGYVGFVVAFAFAVAAMMGREMDARWVRWSRPWTNVAWAFLTLGIGLGSWWAYYELGWGGWWFWDPVENASFMPWLVGTALIHSQAVTEKRDSFRGWTLLLAIAAFSLSLLGAFLVRSGVLTSVHAFASDPERGLFILIFLGVIVGGSLALYAWRAPTAHTGKPSAPLSRETFLLINNLLFSAAAAMVLIGTLYPLLVDALGLGKISVGPPYFGLLFVALMVPVVVLVPFGPFARWQREQWSRFRPLIKAAASTVVVALIALWAFRDDFNLKAFAGLVGFAWVLAGVIAFVVFRWRNAAPGKRFTGEVAGMTLAHAGIAVFVLGVFMTEGTSIERDVAVGPGDTTRMLQYDFRFDGVERIAGPNYVADRGTISIFRDGKQIAVLQPEKRGYASGGQIMTEAAIDPALSRDLYVALGEPLGRPEAGGAERWSLRLYVKPWIRCIWLGALMMMAGGFIAAGDRRFRRASAADLRARTAAAAPTAGTSA